MQRYRKWVLTLAILSMTPGITQAALPQLFKVKKQNAARSQAKGRNQKTAEQIATALRAAKLEGYDISIEFKNGVASLTGKVVDSQQKERATRCVESVQGVDRVENRLILIPNSRVAKPHSDRQTKIVQADHRFSSADARGKASKIRQAVGAVPFPPEVESQSGTTNQQMAERIAAALGRSALTGYDIEIFFQKGAASLTGAVATPQERSRVTEVVSTVPGVDFVNNRLLLLNAPQQAYPTNAAPVYPVAYQSSASQVPPAVNPPMADGQSNIPAPPSYGHPGSGQSHMAYDMPHLPEYAWPAYASYPNYAQVTYPKEYAASAWPYIGPFYPYPQIPLGWRQVQLEWDDGHWSLNFRPRTEKWWWFLDPENW